MEISEILEINEDPIEWWYDNKNIIPTLSNLAGLPHKIEIKIEKLFKDKNVQQINYILEYLIPIAIWPHAFQSEKQQQIFVTNKKLQGLVTPIQGSFEHTFWIFFCCAPTSQFTKEWYLCDNTVIYWITDLYI